MIKEYAERWSGRQARAVSRESAQSSIDSPGVP
jgi:hypothetical protein